MKKALFWNLRPDGKIACQLCPHKCVIAEGKHGFCRSRINRDSVLYADSYGVVTACHIDPIEKKPLYHFHPGSQVLSIGTYGCNLRCDFCQNHSISQIENPKIPTSSPESIVEMSMKTDGIAFTYSEPITWIEYVIDTCRINEKYNILVSNGYILPEPLELLIEHIDAANIDIKGGHEFYQKLCHSPYFDTLETVSTMYDRGVHVEATTLLIDKYNTDTKWLEDMCTRLVDISPDIPLHFSRFFPHYKMRSTPPTMPDSLDKALQIAKDAGVKYVYLGNIGGVSLDTRCPICQKTIVERDWISSTVDISAKGACPSCNTAIYGKW